MIDPQTTTHRGAYFAGFGTFPTNFQLNTMRRLLEILKYLRSMGINADLNAVFAWVLGDINGETMATVDRPEFKPFFNDMIAPATEIVGTGTGWGGDHAAALAARPLWGPILSMQQQMFGQKVIRRGGAAIGVCPFGSWDGAHAVINAELVRLLRSETHDHDTRLGVTILPDESADRIKLADNPDYITHLSDTGQMYVLVMDMASKLAHAMTWQFQDKLVINGILSLIRGIGMTTSQRSAADALKALGYYGDRILGVSFGLEPLTPKEMVPERDGTVLERLEDGSYVAIANGRQVQFDENDTQVRRWDIDSNRWIDLVSLPEPTWWDNVRYSLGATPPSLPMLPSPPALPIPEFDTNNTVGKIVAAFETAMENEDWRSVDGPMNTEKHLMGVVSLPIPPEYYPQQRQEIHRLVMEEIRGRGGIWRKMNFIWTDVPGVPIPHNEFASYVVQTSVFYIVDRVLAIDEIVEEKKRLSGSEE